MKSQTESLEHASVRQYCKAVRMPAVGANFISMAAGNSSAKRVSLNQLRSWARYWRPYQPHGAAATQPCSCSWGTPRHPA